MNLYSRARSRLQGRVILVFLPVFAMLIFAVLALARNVFPHEPAVEAAVRRQRDVVATAEKAAREVELRIHATPPQFDLAVLDAAQRVQAPVAKPDPPKPPPPPRPKPRAGTYDIDGIIMHGGRPMALVNGELYEAGQVVDGSLIVSIARREITLRDAQGKTRTFSVYEDLNSMKGQTNAVPIPR